MSKIKQTITALTPGDNPGGVRVSKEEKEPMSDERLRMLSKRAVQIVAIICGTVLIKDSEPLIGFFMIVVIALIVLLYLGLKG